MADDFLEQQPDPVPEGKDEKLLPGTEAIRAEDSGFLTYRKKILSPVQKKKVPI